MRWFSGSISEAVVSSKSKGAVFVVFVEGTDEASKSTAEAIEAREVSTSLESSDFVAIKLGSGTEEYKQFTEIYRIVPIPSIFFIGGDGRPIEIVAGPSSAAQISQRIATVLGKTKGVQNQAAAAPEQDVLEKPTTDNAGPSTTNSNAVEDSSLEAARKIENAKALLEKTRALKLAEEKAKEREQEEERRRVGREVQELRRWQQDQEMKQLREEREKEKREDAAAREKVKQQIEADKAERARKSREAANLIESKSAPVPAPVITSTASNSTTARLQLRLPDGRTATTTLAATDTLADLRAFAAETTQRSPGQFTLSTAFPRRELDQSLDTQTMTQLELTPTAVVLVLLVASGGAIRSSSSSVVSPLTALFWSLLAPVFSLAAYLRGWLGGGAPTTAGQSGPTIPRTGGQSVGGRPQAGAGPGRREPPTAQVRRQGNVHRLTNARDSSDDETNTWNGNSTQQM